MNGNVTVDRLLWHCNPPIAQKLLTDTPPIASPSFWGKIVSFPNIDGRNESRRAAVMLGQDHAGPAARGGLLQWVEAWRKCLR
ncbi:hypothetical protein SBA_ch1_14210 [Sphingomonas bisphenolicum]|uniref:Uncharacterized protein n=1 Tax=Sphingomonas bisphenolicum TaxID=296544 RepID=A0ABM7G3V6_9SPHN|nr:hypothetical protein SBA_ch1_14210 [Sphingomonas bisphenolicum]